MKKLIVDFLHWLIYKIDGRKTFYRDEVGLITAEHFISDEELVKIPDYNLIHSIKIGLARDVRNRWQNSRYFDIEESYDNNRRGKKYIANLYFVLRKSLTK